MLRRFSKLLALTDTAYQAKDEQRCQQPPQCSMQAQLAHKTKLSVQTYLHPPLPLAVILVDTKQHRLG